MYWFLLPLIAGFLSNLASAFTTTFSEKWGKERGTFLTIILRDVTGIPLWAIGFVLAIRESSELLYINSIFSQVIGWFIIIIGGAVIVYALIFIRSKAAAPSVDDALVNRGIYSYVRHPVHSGTALEFIGLFILWPSISVGISVLIGFLWINFQSVLEEKDLIRRMPAYKDYMNKVPRFIPFRRINK